MNLNDGLNVLFKVGCFVLAGYMAYHQFELYTKNEDSSSLSYHNFNHDPSDLYPTYSVCINSHHGSIFKHGNFLGVDSSLYSNRLVYNHVLLGKCCENAEIMRKAHTFDFDDVLSVDIRHFVKQKMTITREGDELYSWDPEKNSSSEITTFFRSYQDPDRVCMTNIAQYTPHLILKRDFLLLDAEKMFTELMDWNLWKNHSLHHRLYVEFFIHQQDTLIPSLNDPILRLDGFQFEHMKNKTRMVTARINQVDVLEKREDAVSPCNKSLANFDQQYRKSVTDSIGCIPIYWKLFFVQNVTKENVTNMMTLPPCDSKEQFSKLSKYMPLHFQDGTKLFTPSCRQMKLSFDMAQEDISYMRSGELGFTVYYGSETFKYFKNTRSFGIYDLWSQVGGFIGMLLGYSLLQVPSIMQHFIESMKCNTFQKRQK